MGKKGRGHVLKAYCDGNLIELVNNFLGQFQLIVLWEIAFYFFLGWISPFFADFHWKWEKTAFSSYQKFEKQSPLFCYISIQNLKIELRIKGKKRFSEIIKVPYSLSSCLVRVFLVNINEINRHLNFLRTYFIFSVGTLLKYTENNIF